MDTAFWKPYDPTANNILITFTSANFKPVTHFDHFEQIREQ